LQPKKVLVVVGTRPEAIKLAPVIRCLQEHPQIVTEVCATGQHRELLAQALAQFELIPDHDLDVMTDNQTLAGLTSRMMDGMSTLLDRTKPSMVVVQGDTTSAMTAALAAFYHRTAVAHVEAGLRTQDKYSPFPEEINRRIIGGVADLHFPPTIGSRENLLREGVADSQIHVTGNTAIDALLWTIARMNGKEECLPAIIGPALDTSTLAGKRLVLVTAHRRENYDRGIDNICSALTEIAALPDAEIAFPVHYNPNIRTTVLKALGGRRNIHLLEPLGYESFASLLNRAFLVLTDSGGVQEEAPSLGKPVLVMRDTTERPEGISVGNAILVGTTAAKIRSVTTELWNDEQRRLRMARVRNPYGDGSASARIISVLADYFERSHHEPLPS
jgi:UDP-N-acetylglucosamine 2-epimerase (non-hydrolysing)